MSEIKIEDGVVAYPVHPLLTDRIEEDGARAHARYAEEITKNPSALYSWTLTYLIDIFNIHARYHLILIETAEQIRQAYEPYLASLNSNVEKHAEWMSGHWASNDQSSLFDDLRLHLIARSSHWRSEGFAKVRNAKVAAMPSAPTPPQELHTAPVDPPIAAESYSDDSQCARTKYPKRALWLAKELHDRRWDHNHLVKNGGGDRKTILKILDGKSVRIDSLDKIVSGLNRKILTRRITADDIPSD